MFRSLALTCTFLLLVDSLSAQETIQVPWANKFFQPKDPPPVIVHDFGAVPNGTIVTQRFPIKNIWSVPITIQDVRVQCGCVTASMPKKVLESTEESYMELSMDLRKFPSQHKAVTVWIDLRQGDQYRSTAIMQVRAQSLGDIAITPGNLDFGIVPQGSKITRTVDIQYSGNVPNWQITGIGKNDGSAVSVQVQALAKQRGAVGYRITATLKEDAYTGPIQEQVLLQTNDASNPAITVSVTGTVQPPYNVSPNPIRFDDVRIGESKARNVVIQGSKPFKVVRVEGAGEDVAVRATNNKENRVQAIQFTFQPRQAMDTKREIILITETGAPIPVTLELNAINP